MFINRLQIARCHAESRKAIGRRIACVYETDLSANPPERLERLLDELREVDAHEAERAQSLQRYRPDDHGADWLDISLLLIVAALAAVLAIAAAWIGLR